MSDRDDRQGAMTEEVLVDVARRKGRAKRRGGQEPVELDLERVLGAEACEQIVAVHQALSKLADFSARQAQVVEYRYFLGLSDQETAELLGVTSRTIRNEWARARAWLGEAMRPGPSAKSSQGV